jgi:hypothetical protein
MILVTCHILAKSMALSIFGRGPVRSTRGIGQTKGATMRASSTVFFDVGIAFVTVVTIVGVFRQGRHGENRIVMLIVE